MSTGTLSTPVGTPGNDDSDRLTDLHTTHAGALLGFLLSLTHGDRYAAEDLLQETMLRAWNNLDTFPTRYENQRRWLFKVAHRIAIDAARRRQARPTEVHLLDLTRIPAGDASEHVLGVDNLRAALRHLSPAQRAVLFELYFLGHTSQEAADHLGIPVGTVKSRAHYGLSQLREAITST